MIELCIFMLAVIGMTDIIVESKIFSPVRGLLRKVLPECVYEVFECHQCSGTWCGLICGFLVWGFNWKILILSACAGSFLATMAYLIMEILEGQALLFDFEDDEDEH